jgi:4a-hydroxytetrahydrobiopterin dehydratase
MNNWIEQDNALRGTFIFDNFIQAFSFMTSIAIYAEKLNHHPYWSNVYNKVDIVLQTHDAGNIVTQLDRELASIIDKVYNNYQNLKNQKKES